MPLKLRQHALEEIIKEGEKNNKTRHYGLIHSTVFVLQLRRDISSPEAQTVVSSCGKLRMGRSAVCPALVSHLASLVLHILELSVVFSLIFSRLVFSSCSSWSVRATPAQCVRWMPSMWRTPTSWWPPQRPTPPSGFGFAPESPEMVGDWIVSSVTM